ncbi:hypothetical protein ACL03H_01520 [Saccharopolyspora sp. MS10]|uniref:hypothetical protein n=1 Tax=Saccharopolyspora sp. MS10 TaxID=3385973 RepID=UPI0039A07C6E
MRRDLPTPDVVGAVEAGRLAAAAESGTAEPEGDDVAFRTAAATGQAAAVVQGQGVPPGAPGGADWSGFGSVVPVLAASPGAGASVVAAVLADALQLADRRVLLVDTADPVRSGLAAVARSDGPVFDGPHPAVRIRASWRAHAVLARVETSLPIVTPGMVPPPRFFAAAARSVQATIVDIGHDPWRVAAHPLAGAGAWLRVGEPVPRPVLVCRASRPSLLHAEQVLARLEAWNRTGTIVAPAQLVVLGARKWPAGVAGAAGRRTSALLENAVFLPHDSSVALGGITAEVTPARLRDAATPLLQHLRLLPGPAHSAGNSVPRRVIR